MQVDGLKGGRYFTGEGKLVINARVSAPPGELSKVIRNAIFSAVGEVGATMLEFAEASVSPKPENPSLFMK
jgi:hypothetical protein